MSGVQVNVHAVSSIAMDDRDRRGVRRLVCTFPNKDFTPSSRPRNLADAGSIVAA